MMYDKPIIFLIPSLTKRQVCLSLVSLSLFGLGLGGSQLPRTAQAETNAILASEKGKNITGGPTADQSPLALRSLKSTSSVVLTEKGFSAWWSQFLAQKRTQESTGKESQASTDPQSSAQNGLYPVALSPTDSPNLQAGVQWLDYQLKPGDVISIQVLGYPDFSQKNVLIAPDGTIAIPLLGRVQVTHQGVRSLTDSLNQALSKTLRYPQVSISLEKQSPQRVYVLGAVKNPGSYLLDGQDSSLINPANSGSSRLDYHLSTALMKAGGLMADADLPHVKIFNASKETCNEANILELLAYGNMAHDKLLDLEDVIYVPRLEEAQWNHPQVLRLLAGSNLGQSTYPIRVYGYVTRPDVYQLSPTEMTLQSVLAKSGLDIDRAQPKHIIVARMMPNQQIQAIRVNGTRQDMILFPNDSVIVSKSNWKHWIRMTFGAASAITMPAANLRYILDNNNVVTP